MRTDCAHCGKRIEWWRPLRSVAIPTPGKRIARSALKCPFCCGLLRANIHPKEETAIIAAEIAALPMVVVVFAGVRSAALMALALAAFLACGAVLAFVHVRTREWSRYARVDTAEG